MKLAVEKEGKKGKKGNGGKKGGKKGKKVCLIASTEHFSTISIGQGKKGEKGKGSDR